jgi:hypothetical protein
MRCKLIILLLLLCLGSLSSIATNILLPNDTSFSAQNRFVSDIVHIPKTLNHIKLISEFMEYLKDGKRTIGFLHKDDLALIEEKKYVEKRLLFDSYKIVSVGRRMSEIKIYAIRGSAISCKKIILRYYPNMYGHFYLVPGKIEAYTTNLGGKTIRMAFLHTWTLESLCN